MPLRVVELFAGVGGFRIGLEGPPGSPRDGNYKVVWSNQWEPSTKKQHAAEVYVERWGLTQSSTNPLEFHGEGETFVNDDIAEISDDEIPDHDLIVGGFPCQDYSVARTSAKGLEGVKGVLWWQIHRIMSSKRPKYAMLENVDRLLKSPTSQRGRDFAVMLASLAELGYIVEWRVINAADYGMPQRRRRVFILAYAPGTPQYEALKDESKIKQWIETDGTMAKAFPVKPLNILVSMPSKIKQNDKSDLADVSDNFNKGANPKSKSPFKKSGVMVGNNYYTYDTKPNYNGPHTNLSQVLLTPSKVPIEYVLEPDSVMKTKGWKYLKGAKDEPRKGRDDFTYSYKEGPMIFPDALDKPSRTIITGEGGATPSRFKHVVKFKPTKKMNDSFDLKTKECQAIRKEFGLTKSEWLRRLTPVELERLNMFPDNHTGGPTDGKRAFFMGNALVIGIITRLGKELYIDDQNVEIDEVELNTEHSSKIQIPWELFLAHAEDNRKHVERCVLKSCRNWPTSDYVKILQQKLDSFRENQDEKLKVEIETLSKKTLPELREKKRLERDGFELTPSVKYPDGRIIIFVKPGKEAYDVKDNGKFEIYNPDDMLPLVLKDGVEVKLSIQKNNDATMGELARELGIIKRVDSEIFGEVCALLIRMSMYYDGDHEKVENGGYAWSPNSNVRNRISKLNDKLSELGSRVDLWNFLLTCHAISLQEDVKYNKDFCKRRNINTSKIGRYTHLSSMVLWGDLLGSTTDDGIAVHASKFDSVLVHNAVITLSLKEIKDIFRSHMAVCSAETQKKLDLESSKTDELKQYCRDFGLKVGGKKSELVERLIPYYSKINHQSFRD